MATTDFSPENPVPQVAVSRREAEVLTAVGAHLANTEIAAELGISVRTVESHVSALLRKFGVADRRALARAAANTDARFAEHQRLAGLPLAYTSFIGRAHELDAAVPAVTAPGLLTLVGPGGVGKTRLACTIAERAAPEFRDGGTYVDLVPASPQFATQTVAAALGVTEIQQQPLARSIATSLAERHALIVLDNCEHALATLAPLVERLLATCPQVTVLATSRERLGLPGERVQHVGPLPLASDAETLFTDRARAADPHFDAPPAVIAAICARLDGLPLAIELAAARAASLGAEGLSAALDDTLQAVAGGRGGDQRHASLRAVIDWSHRLLGEAERRLFAELSVFSGSFDLAAATAVAEAGSAADVLGRLVDKCLILRDESGRRWRMLRTIRAFADGQVGEQARAGLRSRHLAWAAGQAEELLGRAAAAGEWTSEFDLVADDLRAALAAAEPGPDGRRLAWDLARLAYVRRLLRESVAHFKRAADLACDDQEAAVALRVAGNATFAIDRADQAYALFLASASRAGSGREAVISRCEAALTASRFPSGFSHPVASSEAAELTAPPDDPEAKAYLDAARVWATSAPAPELITRAKQSARLANDSILLSAALSAEAESAMRSGRFADARTATAERVRLLGTMDRNDPRHAAELLEARHTEWLLALSSGRVLEALDVARRISDDDLLGTHPYRPAAKLIPPLVLLGRFDEALSLAEPLWQAWRRSGIPAATLISPAASCIALVHGLRGDESARQMWEQRARDAVGAPDAILVAYHTPFARFVALRLAIHHGGGQALDADERATASTPLSLTDYIRAAEAELAVINGSPIAAERLQGSDNPWVNACMTRARGRLDADPGLLKEAAELWDGLGARFERASTLALMPEPEEGVAELRSLGVPAAGA